MRFLLDDFEEDPCEGQLLWGVLFFVYLSEDGTEGGSSQRPFWVSWLFLRQTSKRVCETFGVQTSSGTSGLDCFKESRKISEGGRSLSTRTEEGRLGGVPVFQEGNVFVLIVPNVWRSVLNHKLIQDQDRAGWIDLWPLTQVWFFHF